MKMYFKFLILLLSGKVVRKEDYKEEYNEVSETYYRWIQRMGKYSSEILGLDIIDSKKEINILDFACGTGYFTQNLIKLIDNKNLKITSKTALVVKVASKLRRLIRPESIQYTRKIRTWIFDFLTKRNMESASSLTNNPDVLFIGAMHFMDPYNYDFDRLERCCVHYATPDGSVMPFCAYNVFYRKKIEKNYSA